ncbi:MAG: TRAP transporter substrate-binding protein [Fimbriimonadaceae bacterium]|nr:TRAP transporter substrate-binding protein [Alphaproteobacteria bacterium]
MASLTNSSRAEELKFAHFVPPQHTITASLIDPLSEGVAKATGGNLTIRTYPGGELGKGPVEQYVRAVQGVADITWGLQGYTSSQFPKSMLVELPGAVPEGMSGYDMLWNAYEEHLQSEFPGTKPLALWVSEPNVMIMKDHQIRKPSDLAGLKIRVAGAVAADVVSALGATPVQMPIPQVYNALQTGLIDGVFTGSSAIADFKLDEVANSYTIGAPLGRISFYVVMNQAKYDGLSDEMKAAIDANSGRGLSQSAEDAWHAKGAKAIAAAKAAGNNTVIELSIDEAAAFAEITLAVRDRVISDLGADAIVASMRGN